MEERRFLGYKGDGFAVGRNGERGNRYVVAEDFATLDIVETFEERDDGCFPASRCTYKRCKLAFLDCEVESRENSNVTGGVFELL